MYKTKENQKILNKSANINSNSVTRSQNKNDSGAITPQLNRPGSSQILSDDLVNRVAEPGASKGRKFKIPPIITKNLDAKRAKEAFEKMRLKMKIVNVSSVTSKLYVSDIGERDVIKDLLNKKDVEYYTYSTRDEKPISLLLKGLHDSTKEEDLVEEIKKTIS